jgi:phage shock protein C
MSETKLTRSRSDQMIAGVCGGLAEYLDLDPVLVRLAFVVLLFASGVGLPIYIVLWIIMPERNGETAVYAEPSTEPLKVNVDNGNGNGRVSQPVTIGAILLLLGFYFLFREIGWLTWLQGGLIWPLIIIAFGFYLIRKS